jgi:chromosome segregation ATPase
MKKMIGLLLYGAVIFGVTAGVGIFMAKKQAAHTTAEDAEGHGEESEEGHSEESSHADAGHGSEHASATASSLTGHGTPQKAHEDEQLPVAVRSSPMTVEEIVRMGLSLKSRDEAVRKREETLREMETQQRLIMSDIASAQQEVENLLAQTSDQRAAKEELLNRIIAQSEALELERKSVAEEQEKQKAELKKVEEARLALESDKTSLTQRENDLALKTKELDTERKRINEDGTRYTQGTEALKIEREKWVAEKEEIASQRKSLDIDRKNLQAERDLLEQQKRGLAASSANPTDAGSASGTNSSLPLDPETKQKNIKQTAERVAAMSPEKAAEAIRALSSNGKEDEAVAILLAMEQRKAGAIMDSLNDDTLAGKFVELMNNQIQQKKAAKKP